MENDNDFDSEQFSWIIDAFKTTVERFGGNPFPQDPIIQLKLSIEAVFKSWLNKRAVTYRKINNIPLFYFILFRPTVRCFCSFGRRYGVFGIFDAILNDVTVFL